MLSTSVAVAMSQIYDVKKHEHSVQIPVIFVCPRHIHFLSVILPCCTRTVSVAGDIMCHVSICYAKTVAGSSHTAIQIPHWKT
jgi:hypothetical protein